MFSDGLFHYVTNDAGVKALLGATRADGTKGMFPMLAPEEATLPFIVYQQVSAEQVISFQGVNRFQGSKYRFSCYGDTYRKSNLLALALKNALDGLMTTFNDGSEVQGAWRSNEMDDSEPIPHGTIFASHIDYDFKWTDHS